MIFYLVTAAHHYTVSAYFQLYRSCLAVRPQVLSYEQLPGMRSLQAGTYIFSDLERLRPRESEAVAQVWDRLAQAGTATGLLNHPTRSLRRYELLRTLYSAGINAFNVYHTTDRCLPQRFPVFIRCEDDHGGSLTPLLHSPEELATALVTLEHQSHSRENKLIVELCNTADAQGITRKYSAFIIAGQIFPFHLFFSRTWMVKSDAVLDQLSTAMQEEERHYLATNPHEPALRNIATLANIQYGRIDYGIKDGAVQVWEINTNPALPRNKDPRIGGYTPAIQQVAERYNVALQQLAQHCGTTTPIPNPLSRSLLRSATDLLLDTLPLRYEPYVRQGLKDWLARRGQSPFANVTTTEEAH